MSERGGCLGLRSLCMSLCLILLSFCSSEAKLRWSTLHSVPDADFVEGYSLQVDAFNFNFNDSTGSIHLSPGVVVDLGIAQWMTIQAGYVGAPTFGLKVRIISEKGIWIPSVAAGVHNIITHKEMYLYNETNDSVVNEVFIAFGKTLEPLKLQFHAGIQSIPLVKQEMVNPFFVLEKYIGAETYVGLEAFRRVGKFHYSLFGTVRFLNRHIELSLGLVDIEKLFLLQDKSVKFALFEPAGHSVVKPGVRAGLRANVPLQFGKQKNSVSKNKSATTSSEILVMRAQIDSLRSEIKKNSLSLATMNSSFNNFSDKNSDESFKMEELTSVKLIAINNLFNKEPFEPEVVGNAIKELASYRDKVLPSLQKIARSKNQDRSIRLLAIKMLGEIGSKNASDLLLEIIGQSKDPQFKIESLIALGKMSETRALFLIQQLTGDPDDAVAFTASEVLQKLSKEMELEGESTTKYVPPESIKDKQVPLPEESKPQSNKNQYDDEVDAISIIETQPINPPLNNDFSSSTFTKTK